MNLFSHNTLRWRTKKTLLIIVSVFILANCAIIKFIRSTPNGRTSTPNGRTQKNLKPKNFHVIPISTSTKVIQSDKMVRKTAAPLAADGRWNIQKSDEDRLEALALIKVLVYPKISLTSKSLDVKFQRENPPDPPQNKVITRNSKWSTWPECLCGPMKGYDCSPEGQLKREERRPLEDGGSCSWRAWRESKDSVISVSVYGPSSAKASILKRKAESIGTHYPEWSLWIYQRHPDPRLMCDLLRFHPRQVFFCDTRILPTLGDLKRVAPAAWKVSPLGDKKVRRLLVRDIDNSPAEREASAVRQWLNTNMTWHTIHDHPNQKKVVEQGLWGAQWNSSQKIDMVAIRNSIILNCQASFSEQLVADVIKQELWPRMYSSKSLIRHDSYGCLQKIPGTHLPFPTKRNGNSYIGMISEDPKLSDCPTECRPYSHKDWNKC